MQVLKPSVFNAYNSSQFRLATFQVFNSHMWPGAAMLDSAVLPLFLRILYVPIIPGIFLRHLLLSLPLNINF